MASSTYIQMDRTLQSQPFTDFSINPSLYDSHYTAASQLDNQSTWFIEQRAYSRSVLAAWGLPLGELPYNRDNEQTLRCLVELIGFRQREIQFRAKVKDEMAALGFEKEKYRSFMEQAQRGLEECMKKLGRTENESAELKVRGKKGEALSRKERQQDKKMIAMLRAKNEQILHEIKKKEQEVYRVKEQMKKSVGEKNNSAAKNSFEIFETLSPAKLHSKDESKYIFLLERSEREIAQLTRENAVIREKVFELRDKLLDFNEWIDKELFGEATNDPFKRNSRFPLNHNLLFKKQSLTDQFEELLEVARDGLGQLRDMLRSGTAQKIRSTDNLVIQELQEPLSFKKKMNRQPTFKTDRNKPAEVDQDLQLKELKRKKTGSIKKIQKSQAVTPRSNKFLPTTKIPISQSSNSISTRPPKKQVEKHPHQSSEYKQGPFLDELLSDIGEGHDSSIVSHIEVEQLGKDKFDRWDLLYREDE